MVAEPEFVEPKGDSVAVDDLQHPKARELARYLASGSEQFSKLLEVRRQQSSETVIFTVEPEIPQEPAHPILRLERLAVIFFIPDNQLPETLALRRSFPRVLHVNTRDQEIPRSLCLWEQHYSELKLQWTAARYIRRVRAWLAGTADGSLHSPDQPLEPFLADPAGTLVVPPELYDAAHYDGPILKLRLPDGDGVQQVLVADHRFEEETVGSADF
ncbi:MAG: hypothetical protein IH899_13480, partial [Planctomycetes bacterium]|nr:hypothetical protein [Planctomycetota bacterium]